MARYLPLAIHSSDEWPYCALLKKRDVAWSSDMDGDMEIGSERDGYRMACVAEAVELMRYFCWNWQNF